MTEFINLQPVTVRREWVRNEILSVGTASIELAPARPRKMILVRNTSTLSTQIITINLGFGSAIANQGIVLNQNESFNDSTNEGYEAYDGSITCISAVAGGQLSITER